MMNEIRIIEDIDTKPDLPTVLGLLNCARSNPAYEDMVEAYEDLYDEVIRALTPKASLAFDTVQSWAHCDNLETDSTVLYAVLTIGQGVSDIINKYFQTDVVYGMVADAMADSCLFHYGDMLIPRIRKFCLEHSVGVIHKYEAPSEIPMEMQKIGFEACKADELLGLSITEGYMYAPVKSICYVYELTENTKIFELEHDCSKCGKVNCTLRRARNEFNSKH